MTFFTEWSVKFSDLLIKDFGFTPLDCHAIMGNLGHESNGFQSLQEVRPLVPGSRGGYGIAQWTGPRRRNYETYCVRNDLNPADMMTNYKFLFVELSGDEKASVAKVKVANSLEAKTEAFMKGFLRPGIPHLDSRIIWAKRAQVAWNSRSNDLSVPNKPLESAVPSTPVAPEPVQVPDQSIPQSPKQQTLWSILVEILRAIFGSRSK